MQNAIKVAILFTKCMHQEAGGGGGGGEDDLEENTSKACICEAKTAPLNYIVHQIISIILHWS